MRLSSTALVLQQQSDANKNLAIIKEILADEKEKAVLKKHQSILKGQVNIEGDETGRESIASQVSNIQRKHNGACTVKNYAKEYIRKMRGLPNRWTYQGIKKDRKAKSQSSQGSDEENKYCNHDISDKAEER